MGHESINGPLDGAYLADFSIDINILLTLFGLIFSNNHIQKSPSLLNLAQIHYKYKDKKISFFFFHQIFLISVSFSTEKKTFAVLFKIGKITAKFVVPYSMIKVSNSHHALSTKLLKNK